MITAFQGSVDCLLEIVLTGFISLTRASEDALGSVVIPRPATAAPLPNYSITPTGPGNTALQGWEQVVHCRPVRGKSLVSAASATR